MKTQEHKDIVLHGSAVLLRSVAHPPAAVFFRGLSGAGKSDLSFRLIEKGAALICDDQVSFSRRNDKIFVGAIDSIRGLLEVRGVGLLRYPAEEKPQQLKLAVDLVRREDVPRLPEWKKLDVLGLSVPLISLHAFDASVLAKVVRAMQVVHHPDLMV